MDRPLNWGDSLILTFTTFCALIFGLIVLHKSVVEEISLQHAGLLYYMESTRCQPISPTPPDSYGQPYPHLLANHQRPEKHGRH